MMNCFLCKGSLTDSTTNHVVNLKKRIIIIKNVPCTECTQCGETYYDDNVAAYLEQIVDNLKNIYTEVAIVNYSDNIA